VKNRKNPKKDIGRAVLLSLAIQGAVCYLFEYFAANYFLNSGYTISNRRRFRRSAWRHDGARRHMGVWQLCSGPGVSCSCRPALYSRVDRHNSGLHQHGCAVTYAMGRDEGSAVTLRPPAWQDALSAPRDLDAWW